MRKKVKSQKRQQRKNLRKKSWQNTSSCFISFLGNYRSTKKLKDRSQILNEVWSNCLFQFQYLIIFKHLNFTLLKTSLHIWFRHSGNMPNNREKLQRPTIQYAEDQTDKGRQRNPRAYSCRLWYTYSLSESVIVHTTDNTNLSEVNIRNIHCQNNSASTSSFTLVTA